MKNHPPILFLVLLIAFACYFGWAFITGSLRIRGKEPISRQDSPHEYWYYMRIVLVLFGILVGMTVWMFL